jgi:hypothetical protein
MDPIFFHLRLSGCVSSALEPLGWENDARTAA